MAVSRGGPHRSPVPARSAKGASKQWRVSGLGRLAVRMLAIGLTLGLVRVGPGAASPAEGVLLVGAVVAWALISLGFEERDRQPGL